MAVPIPIYPAQNLPLVFGPLYAISSSTGVQTPLTTGTCTIFLSTTNTSDAVTANAAFSGSATSLGNGYWQLLLAGSALTLARLVAAFGSANPWVLAFHSAGEWAYAPAELIYSREAP